MVVRCEGILFGGSPSSLPLRRALKQSDVHTCLRLVIGQSEVSSRDVVPLANTASFISYTHPGGQAAPPPTGEPLLHTCLLELHFSEHHDYYHQQWACCLITFYPQPLCSYMSHICGWDNSGLSGNGRPGLIFDRNKWEFLTQFSHRCYCTLHLQQGFPCGLFSLDEGSFSWWGNKQTRRALRSCWFGVSSSVFSFCLKQTATSGFLSKDSQLSKVWPVF